MKRWTEADIRNANIVDYEQFNNEYNASKSSINGGLDRTQIPANIVSKSYIKDNATHTVYLNDEPEFASDTFFVDILSGTGSNPGFRGLTYSTYSGGWITVVDREYTGLKDGMMQIEFMAHLYINLQFSRGDGEINQKGVQFVMEWNGVPMLNTFDFAKPIQTIRLFANTFSPGGTGKLTIKAKMTPKGKTDWLHRTQFHIFGIRTMLIGRWR